MINISVYKNIVEIRTSKARIKAIRSGQLTNMINIGLSYFYYLELKDRLSTTQPCLNTYKLIYTLLIVKFYK